MSNNTTVESKSPEDIVLRKWHDGNKKHEYCTLRELWENGFANGQSYQQYNQHMKEPKYLNGNGFHVKPEFFDEAWKAFWSDSSGIDVIVNSELTA